MTIPLGTVLAPPLTVTTPELGERTDLGLVSQPGSISVLSIPSGADPLKHLLARAVLPPAELLASGDVVQAIPAGELNDIDVRRAGVVRRSARVRLTTAQGDVVIERDKDASGQLLTRAAQRAYGFARVPSWDGQRSFYDLWPAEGDLGPWGLVLTPDGLRLFEFPPMDVGDRVTSTLKSVGSVVLDVAAGSSNPESRGDSQLAGPTRLFHDRELGAYFNGKHAPASPAAVGGEGRVTQVAFHERDPAITRIEATVDGRLVALRTGPEHRVALHHLTACTLGSAAYAV